MRKYLGWVCLILVVFLLVPAVTLAAYEYSIPISIYNNQSSSWGGPVLVTLNNSQLAALGYIESSGLDTNVQEGATDRDYMVADARLGILVEDIDSYQERSYNYRLGQDPAQIALDFMVGSGGYATYSDHADLEISDNFNITYYGYVDTSYPTLTYPTVENITTSIEGSGTSHTVNLTYGNEVGDLLIIIFGGYLAGGDPDVTLPNGWTSLLNSESTGRTCAVAYRVADGTESTNVTLTTDSNCYSAHQCYRISGYAGVPLLESASYYFGTYPDPPSITAPWSDEAATLWIAGWGGGDGTDISQDAIPTNYGNEIWRETSSGYAYASSARREATTESEDPEPYFDISSDAGGYAFTIGIRGEECWAQVIKIGSWEWTNTGLNEMSATVLGGGDATVVLDSLSSGTYLLDAWADGTNLGVNIDGSCENVTALGGASAAGNANDWYSFVPYFASYNHTVNGTREVWYEPNTMILGTSLTDRSGNGHTGTISWGSNPSWIEVEIGGIEPFTAYTAVEEDEAEEAPWVVPNTGNIPTTPTPGATGIGLPLYANFLAAADSLDWSVPVTYSVMFIIISVVVGFAGLSAMGTGWGFTVGCGATMAFFSQVQDGGGYRVLPIGIALAVVLVSVILGYLWSRT